MCVRKDSVITYTSTIFQILIKSPYYLKSDQVTPYTFITYPTFSVQLYVVNWNFWLLIDTDILYDNTKFDNIYSLIWFSGSKIFNPLTLYLSDRRVSGLQFQLWFILHKKGEKMGEIGGWWKETGDREPVRKQGATAPLGLLLALTLWVQHGRRPQFPGTIVSRRLPI